jgi:hypothetical protein
LARETEELGENLTQCRFVHKPHMLCPDANPGRRGGKPATYRLSYGTAFADSNILILAITKLLVRIVLIQYATYINVTSLHNR